MHGVHEVAGSSPVIPTIEIDKEKHLHTLAVMTNLARKLAVFIMGGTIDSRNAPERDGESVVLRESLVKKYLENLHINADIVVQVICMKDSRSIGNEDRDALAQAIEACGATYNLVTHGTYTMKMTGEDLLKRSVFHTHVIGLTGSMGTLLGTVDDNGHLLPSDGQFNLGYAIGEIFHLEAGVYQFMNGEKFRLPNEWWSHTAESTSWKKNGEEKILSTSH